MSLTEKSVLQQAASQRGSITIFLSLSLLVMISFVSTALQSARLAGSRYLFLLASESMVTSMCGAFDEYLWEQYRVLGLADVRSAMEVGRACGEIYEREEGLFRITMDSCEMTDQVTLADQGADGWLQSVTSYMEQEIPADLLSVLWEETGLAERFSDMAGKFQDIRALIEPVTDLEKQIGELETQYSRGLELWQSSRRIASELESLIAQLEDWQAETQLNGQSAGQSDLQPDEESSRQPDRQEDLQEILDAMNRCREELVSLLGSESGLSSMYSQARRVVTEAEALREQLSRVLGSLGDGEEDSFLSVVSDLGGYTDQLVQRIDRLTALPDNIQKLIQAGGRVSDLPIPSVGDIVSGEGIRQFSQWEEFLGELGGMMLAGSAENLTEGSDADRALLADFWNLKEWLSGGLLRIVLPEGSQVSDRQITRLFTRTERSGDTALSVQAYQNLLYGEYALRYTAHYGEAESPGILYETEYLIGGNRSDSENLAEVVLALLGIRGAANLIYLLQDSSGRSQAEAAARGVSAALGGLLPVSVATVLLLTLWAAAEAVCDIRALLTGQKVPLWKTAETWRLSWEQLWKLAGAGISECGSGGGAAEGLEYEDYLRLLLYLTPLRDKCYRTMEAAEENLGVLSGGLRLDQTIYQATWRFTGKAAGASCELSLTYGY